MELTMKSAIAIPDPNERWHRHSFDHAGKVRAVARALLQDLNILREEVPHLAEPLRHIIDRDRRRAAEILRGAS